MEAHTVKDAVQQMSVLMANLYYYLTREFVETYGDGAKDVICLLYTSPSPRDS